MGNTKAMSNTGLRARVDTKSEIDDREYSSLQAHGCAPIGKNKDLTGKKKMKKTL